MDISESANKLLLNGSVDLRFYETFLDSYPKFQEFFRGTNMQRQSNLLISALVMVEAHHAKENEGFAAYLKHLGSDHEKRGITADHYAMWTEAMLASLKLFHGDEWSDELNNAWDTAIEKAVSDILSGYASA